ncbi:conserved hypothetical protein [gamma proteobacterium HTCC5015]|nr:conserved hypothetical protein [gamma proteobacterium HTCC5015]
MALCIPLFLKIKRTTTMAKKSLTISSAIGLTLAATLSAGTAQADQANPFGMSEMSSGYQVAGDHEGKCGEGKCGEDKAKREGKCGEGKCGEDKAKAAAEGKCGEGKCGEDKAKADSEGKCGEGKCGGDH